MLTDLETGLLLETPTRRLSVDEGFSTASVDADSRGLNVRDSSVPGLDLRFVGIFDVVPCIQTVGVVAVVAKAGLSGPPAPESGVRPGYPVSLSREDPRVQRRQSGSVLTGAPVRVRH